MSYFRKKCIGTIAYMGGVPALYEEFTWAWTQMILHNHDYLCANGEEVYYTRSKVSDHAYARSSLALGIRGDWLLMLDTDHQFEPDLAARMVHTLYQHNIDVLVGLYLFKRPPHPPVLFTRLPTGQLTYLADWEFGKGKGKIPKGQQGRHIMEVASSGAGALLVRKEVFDKVTKRFKRAPFSHLGEFSEDHSFFERLRILGIKSYCCPAIETPHIMVKPVSTKDYIVPIERLGEKVSVEGRVLTEVGRG